LLLLDNAGSSLVAVAYRAISGTPGLRRITERPGVGHRLDDRRLDLILDGLDRFAAVPDGRAALRAMLRAPGDRVVQSENLCQVPT
jgi:hypothetical protein